MLSSRPDAIPVDVVPVAAPADGDALRTNAPDGWPRVRVPRGHSTESASAFTARAASLVAEALTKAGFRVAEFSREIRDARGVVVVDVVLEDGTGQQIPVLVFPGQDPGAEQARFKTARALVADRFGHTRIVWYVRR